jgi:hypothetical protein
MRRQKMGNGGAARGCASQMEQHQIGGLAANAPANKETEIGGECAGQVKQRQIGGGSAGNAPAKWNNTKSVAARWGMRWPNGTTPNRWIGGECAGETEQHQIGGSAANTPAKRNNTKSVERRRMRRPNERECGAAMRCAGRTATPNRWVGGECAGETEENAARR